MTRDVSRLQGGIMNIFIEYCGAWNFLPQASRVEAELRAHYPDLNVKLIESGGGIFDVKCNDKLIYSKQNIEGRRFPNKGEITKLIEQEKG
jgi:selT/selW/selH-like putative selenoprotein